MFAGAGPTFPVRIDACSGVVVRIASAKRTKPARIFLIPLLLSTRPTRTAVRLDVLARHYSHAWLINYAALEIAIFVLFVGQPGGRWNCISRGKALYLGDSGERTTMKGFWVGIVAGSLLIA